MRDMLLEIGLRYGRYRYPRDTGPLPYSGDLPSPGRADGRVSDTPPPRPQLPARSWRRVMPGIRRVLVADPQ